VEIKANVNIDRGTLGDTVIGKGTKIDSLTHIAHNAQIGEYCVIVCLTCIAGGVKIRDGAWVAPLAGIREGREVGENAVVGMGAIVIRDVKPGDVVAGVPAKSIKKVGD
jgi:UDP-3-O-[3-hydroxymyristoyl] glucosamine N-acyltransferase